MISVASEFARGRVSVMIVVPAVYVRYGERVQILDPKGPKPVQLSLTGQILLKAGFSWGLVLGRNLT